MIIGPPITIQIYTFQVMLIVEDCTVKIRTAMKTMFLYLIVHLSVMLDIISCSFTFISLDTNQQ